MNKIIIVAGPTAVGKTECAIELAEDLKTEIVSADSMQIYKYMDIGTAKPTSEELSRVRHHMIDVANPLDNNYSVAVYKRQAEEVIRMLHGQGKIPIISGGTGLYLSSILYDMDFSNATYDPEYRSMLQKLSKEKGNAYLYNQLKSVDSDSADIIHPNNVKRVIRALEVHHATGLPIKKFASALNPTPKYETLFFRLHRERTLLYDRINLRVEGMLEAGLIDEVVKLTQMGLTEKHMAMKGIGYKEVLEHLSGITGIDEMKYKIKLNSRHYAKRQMTWFRRYNEAIQIEMEASKTSNMNKLLAITNKFIINNII